MRVAVIFFFILITPFLHADPDFLIMSAGISPFNTGLFMSVGMPLKLFSPKTPGSVVMRIFSRSNNIPQGFESEIEPYSWWVPTGEEIWSIFTASLGLVIDVPGNEWLSISPYMGIGDKSTYTQYLSSATQWYFYNKTSQTIYDAGLDAHIYSKYYGIVMGVSVQSKLHVGVLLRF